MTEYTFTQVCQDALDDLVADARESSLISTDLAGLLVKLTFYVAMLLKD